MRGFIFTSDMLIALSIIFILFIGFFLFKFETSTKEREFESLSYISEDIMNILSNLKVNETQDDPTISELIANNSIKEDDMDKTIIDLITSYWYSNNTQTANDITNSILSNITEKYCVRIAIDEEQIYSGCEGIPDNTTISSSSRIETGYEMERPTYGYISRAYLTSLTGKVNFDYIYFGGYEGEGNLTKIIELPEDIEINAIKMEMDAGSEFDLYINDNFAGTYSPTAGNMSADVWHVCNQTVPAYCSFVTSGNNTFHVNFTSWEDSYVGGGYIKISYNTSEFSSQEDLDYKFPGISGLVNLYSSFYIPGQLNSMDAYIHYTSDYLTFFNIGNVTIINDSSPGEKIVSINDSTLSSLLDYGYMANKTIPIRFGTEAFQEIIIGNADVMLVTDLSGSMQACSNEEYGSDPHTDTRWTTWWDGGYRVGAWRTVSISNCDDNAQRNYEIAKDANDAFVHTVLNTTGNRAGVVDYTGSYYVYYYHPIRQWIEYFPDNLAGEISLTNDEPTLQNHIDDMETWWGTCICCGINKAKEIIEDESSGDKTRAMVIMSDGEANKQCSEQGTGSSKQDAIQAGQEACDAGINVYAVGFGEGADENTLQQIACNPSKYYSSQNVSELIEIYSLIADDIVEGSYVTQTINVTGNHTKNNTLFPDSHIKFNYTSSVNPFEYGEISVRMETDMLSDLPGYFSNASYIEAGFDVQEEITATNVKITSYSSDFWTDRLYVGDSWERVYWLGDYGSEYPMFGDPFVVNIPDELIESGQTNYIRISTGLAPENSTGASDFDRIIYDARLRGSVGYGDVFSTLDEAVSDAKTRLIQEVETYVDVEEDDIEIQTESLTNMRWLWGPSLIKTSVWKK